MVKGKLIVLYGVNNLGKTTQAKILVEKLKKTGPEAEYLKYPLYDLQPTGPRINDYLRKGNPKKLTPKQAQELYAQNRADYQKQLEAKLETGINVIAEDYWGTGVAWGVGNGVDMSYLLEINKPFQNEDLAFLLYGERFSSGFEEGHLHEDDFELSRRVGKSHDDLARKFDWIKINANDSVENVAAAIWKEVKKALK